MYAVGGFDSTVADDYVADAVNELYTPLENGISQPDTISVRIPLIIAVVAALTATIASLVVALKITAVKRG